MNHHPGKPPHVDVLNYLRDQEQKSLLRFITCGSVDDGKSTLIGRLLFDTKLIFEDQLAVLAKDSVKQGMTNGDLDFSLLVDGLEAEREQGITIDVAYRFFATEKRKFIVADTPGHEEYTRNMATGASTADLAIVLVDSRKGVLQQTRRHSFIASQLGIRHVVVAVNKIDLMDYDESVFDNIIQDYKNFSNNLDFETITAIPISARFGDNVIGKSTNMPWYNGVSLLEHLETVNTTNSLSTKPFRFPVQYVNRPHQNFRGFAGQIGSGIISVGDEVVVAKSGQASKVKEIVTYEGNIPQAIEGQSVTIVLEDEIEVSRGNILAEPNNRPNVADQFQARVVWFDAAPLMPGRSYILRTENDSVNCTVTAIKHEIDVNTFAQFAAKSLSMNSIGVCNFSLQNHIAFDCYSDSRVTGNFIIVDRFSNATVGAGMIDHPLRRSDNIHWHATEVGKTQRSEMKLQKPCVIWFTGLSASGKSTIANSLEKILHSNGKHTYMLDGDNLRHGLNRDLGFTDEDRVENIRRVGEVSKLMVDAGLIVLVSLISPFKADRNMVRELLGEGEFVEVFVDTTLDECARRDPKGLYKKAFDGLITNFTGIGSPYERPENPEIHLVTHNRSIDELALQVYDSIVG